MTHDTKWRSSSDFKAQQGRQDTPRGRLRVAYTDESTGEVAGRAASRGVCRYVKVSMWHSDTMYALPIKGRARFVYVYLLTGPHTLGYHVPGLYQIGRHALREVLGLGPQEFSQIMRTLENCVDMKTDFERGLIWLPSALDHLGPPSNPNIVRGYCRAMLAMPKSLLIADAICAYRPFLAGLGQIFLEPFEKAFPEVCQTPKKCLNTEKREERKERKSERESLRHDAGLASMRAIVKSLE